MTHTIIEQHNLYLYLQTTKQRISFQNLNDIDEEIDLEVVNDEMLMLMLIWMEQALQLGKCSCMQHLNNNKGNALFDSMEHTHTSSGVIVYRLAPV
jgi:hypothetical protein